MREENVPTQHPQARQASRFPAPDVHPGRAGDPEGPPPEGPRQPVGLIWRVERRDTFRALRHGRRGRAGPLTVTWVAGDPSEPPRVAYAIGRRVGSAVERNRLRRRLRALITAAAPRLPPGSYLVGAAPDAIHLTFPELQTMLTQAISAAGPR